MALVKDNRVTREPESSVELELLRRLEASAASNLGIETGRLKTTLAVLRESYPDLARVVFLKPVMRD